MKSFMSLKPRFCQTYQSAYNNLESVLARKRKRNTLVPWIIAVAFAVTMQEAQACSMNVTGVNFGSYDVFSKAALHSTGNINMNCPNGVGYTIGLSAGSGTYQQRGMSSGTHTLNYNLYTAANRAVVWGDAISGGATESGSGTGMNVNHVVYGRIPPRQNVRAGSYSDTINLIITF
jgi:spore coat protein U-like protein